MIDFKMSEINVINEKLKEVINMNNIFIVGNIKREKNSTNEELLKRLNYITRMFPGEIRKIMNEEIEKKLQKELEKAKFDFGLLVARNSKKIKLRFDINRKMI